MLQVVIRGCRRKWQLPTSTYYLSIQVRTGPATKPDVFIHYTNLASVRLLCRALYTQPAGETFGSC
jgi:hypothetical protein